MHQERTMRIRIRALPLLLIAAATMLLVACGGDDATAEKKSSEATAAPTAALGQAGATTGTSAAPGAAQTQTTPAPANASRSLEVDCGDQLKAFRFTARLAMKSPDSGSNNTGSTVFASPLFGDLKLSGAFVAPDRTSLKLEGGQDSLLGGQAIEFIQIGDTSYTKIGNTGWQSASGAGNALDLTEGLDPRQLCKSVEDSLRADVPSRKEKVNGVDAIRYDYDRKALEKLSEDSSFFGDLTGGELPENFKMNIWVSEKEKFPVRMVVSASGTAEGQKYSMEMEFNVTDLNGNVKIDPPK
jgi:hypothetical protein